MMSNSTLEDNSENNTENHDNYLSLICKFKNGIHDSEYHCSLMYDSSQTAMEHTYHSTGMSRQKNGTPLFTKLKLNNKIFYECSTNSIRGMLKISMSPDAISLSEYLTSPIRFINLIATLLETGEWIYQQFQMYPSAKNLVDVYFVPTLDHFETFFFRPTYFVSAVEEYATSWRKFFFHLLEIYAENKKNDKINVKIKTVSSCNMKHFAKRPAHNLACSVKSNFKNIGIPNNNNNNFECIHVNINSNSTGQIIISSHLMSMNAICNRVLLAQIEQIGEKETGKIYNHCCFFKPELTKAFYSIFGRSNKIHTLLCSPSVFLNSVWLEEFQSFIRTHQLNKN